MPNKPTYEELERRVRDLEGQMSQEKTEWEILTLLAREWDSAGPPGILDNRDLIAGLGVTAEEALPALRKLVVYGAIDKDTQGNACYLTPEGHDLAIKGRRDTPIAHQLGKTGTDRSP